MSNDVIYNQLKRDSEEGMKKFAILIDPDKMRLEHITEIVNRANAAEVDYFFIGGSLILQNVLDQVIQYIKSHSSIPCILFPGNSFQISTKADAILFLSLISGRNPDLLIGHHVLTAPYLRASNLEIMPTGYMLVDGGVDTTARYISNTQPIPYDKDEIAIATAIAGEMLGLRLLYMDAGSGARTSISTEMISAVKEAVEIPIIVGGGIQSAAEAKSKLEAGADVIVIGNAIEKSPELITEIAWEIKYYPSISE